MLRNQLDGLPSIARLRDHFEIGLLIEQQTQARPNDGVVVREQDANLWQVSGGLDRQDTALSEQMRIRPHFTRKTGLVPSCVWTSATARGAFLRTRRRNPFRIQSEIRDPSVSRKLCKTVLSGTSPRSLVPP